MQYRFVGGYEPVWIIRSDHILVDDFCEKSEIKKFKGYLIYINFE